MVAFRNIAIFFVTILVGCSSSDLELWPPTTRAEAMDVLVYCNGFHSVIVIPDEHHQLRGYAYAEELWYLKKSRGCWGEIRAMLWPSQGIIIESAGLALPDAKRYPKRWVYKISPKGLKAMHLYIASMKEEPEPFLGKLGSDVKYFYSHDIYYMFNTCNTFTADVLKASGMPISSFGTITNDSLMEELEELKGQHVKKGLIQENLN